MRILCKMVLSGCLLTCAACQNLPESTRNGDTTEIFIGEQSILGELQVSAGEEMRWTNRKFVPVRITVLDYVLNSLSCRRNFSGHYYSGAEASLLPNESASLCFRNPGIIRYAVKSQGIFQTEEFNIGQIHIEAFPRHVLEQVEENSTCVTQTVYTSWCEEETTIHEPCL